ncbi:hypothetical protein CFREI_07875 [Corynebacterium freiburgense]|nr:hypothetical protein CFREI_07875 [Corynebacterium freiburgense]
MSDVEKGGLEESHNSHNPNPAQSTILEQMGGFGGLVSSTLPVLVLVPINNAYGLLPALIAALVVSMGIFVWRILRKENLQPAFSALFGVALCAGIAWAVGSAKGYFLYGIWMSLIFAVVFGLSIVVRWPLVGVIWKGINGEGMHWRSVPGARSAYSIATLGWTLVFSARFIVQNQLYGSDSTTALAIAKIAMGWPLTGLVTLLTVWAVRRARRCMEEARES